MKITLIFIISQCEIVHFQKGMKKPDIVADGLLYALIRLKSDVWISNQRRPDPPRFGPGRNIF